MQPGFVQKRKAAAFLDMRVSEFDRLVEQGALPPPVKFDRWDVRELERIMSGEAAKYGRLEL